MPNKQILVKTNSISEKPVPFNLKPFSHRAKNMDTVHLMSGLIERVSNNYFGLSKYVLMNIY